MKRLLIGLLAFASVPAQAADYVVIHMERTVDRPAALVWSRVGGYCQIEAWFGTKCAYTAGNGEIGTNRRLNGTIDELMVGKTPLSYAYTQPASPLLYHGNLAVEVVDAGHSRIVYDLLYDAAPLATPQAKAEDMAKRKTRFEAGIDKMKQIAEAAP
jgi:Polyketide cyclase / dehydrase and lipid transport